MTALRLVSDRDRDLRRQLADAQAGRDADDADARLAREAHERVAHALRAAGATVERLKTDAARAQQAVTQAHARRVAEAARAGRDAPAMPVPPMTDPEPLAQAMAHYRALELAMGELSAELTEANNTAEHASAIVREIVEKICEEDARILAQQVIDTMEAHWRALDTLTGYLAIDEARRDGQPHLRELQKETMLKVNRQQRAISENRLMLEPHNWKQHLRDLTEGKRQRWLNYMSRLESDPHATLDPQEPAQ